MKEGFFSSSLPVVRKTPSLVPLCGACGLFRDCNSPKMPYSGKGIKKILIVGESPGQNEDEQGTQFVGVSGEFLRGELEKLDIDMREDCWLTNALICHPGVRAEKENKNIEAKVPLCRPTLLRTIEELSPRVIILLGAVATKSLIGHVWKEDIGSFQRWTGWQIPCHKPNAWICPTYHPSYCLRENNPVLNMYFAHHLEQAIKLKKRPWKEVPNYRSQVECILDPAKAAEAILSFLSAEMVAVDYECDSLKPDRKDVDIICCSISDGQRTIAYPWHGKAIASSKKLFRSKVGKIASNQKYEERWTMSKLGFPMNNWVWDTMLAAHVLDNRSEITGLKFQSFVRLGAGSYDDHIAPYRSSKQPGGNVKNSLRQADLQEILIYNGMDSLLEYKLAEIQMKELGYER